MSKELSSRNTYAFVETKIFSFRGFKVMMDRDLAELYSVPTKALNQAVRRHLNRFPEDFMFRLSPEETQNWRSQFVTSNSRGKMGIRYRPSAFTEHGILMLSSVLNSQRAMHVNIQIMRTFIKLRELSATNELIRKKIEELEQKCGKHDKQFKIVFNALKQVFEAPKTPSKKQIGFHTKY